MRILPLEEEQIAPPFPCDVPDPQDDPQETADWLSEYAAPWLSATELQFCADLARWRGWPSERQMSWLESIAEGIVYELMCAHAPFKPNVCPRCGQMMKGARLSAAEGAR